MKELDNLRGQFPETAKDIKLNLQSVFQSTTLTPQQLWGVAVASAIATRHETLARATLADAQEQVDADTIADAQAAAALMSMNNVYYRFRHMVGEEKSYNTKPARLRMNWMARPRGSKANFELYSLAVSAINGCEMCIRSHEAVTTQNGLTEDQVHDAVRVASTLAAAAVSLEIAHLTQNATAVAG